jgi:hypothetical protein
MPADYVKGSFEAALPGLMSKMWSQLVVKSDGGLSPSKQIAYGHCRRWVSPCVREGVGHCRHAEKQVGGDCIYSVEYGQMQTEDIKIEAITSCRRKIVYADETGKIAADGWEFEVDYGGAFLWLPSDLLNEQQAADFLLNRHQNSQEIAQVLHDEGDWLQVKFINGDVTSLPARDIWIEEHETLEDAEEKESIEAAQAALDDLDF